MSVLFGHPTGGPFSHNAALAHFEAGRLEAFCVPWMPSRAASLVLRNAFPARAMGERLSRRRFAPLDGAPLVQGRLGEMRRLAARAFLGEDERRSYQANDWLMGAMTRECARPRVTAVHSYEDCSQAQFEEAKRLGKACLYDMPIGYYPAWERRQDQLARKYADWLPPGGLSSSRLARPSQKRREMELADLVLAPSRFVERTIKEFHPGKPVALAPYAVDAAFWRPAGRSRRSGPLRFITAGQLSLRKGTPALLAAWESAGLRDAELELVGQWQLHDARRFRLPSGVSHLPACSSAQLRARFQSADVFVFPSNFEGFGLVLLEALACGLPAIASDATAGPDILTPETGRLVAADGLDELVESLRWFDASRERLPAMSAAAAARAAEFTWERYRADVTRATASYI